jgi:hypothetical protein
MSSHRMHCRRGCIAGSTHDYDDGQNESGYGGGAEHEVIRSVDGGACESDMFVVCFGFEGRMSETYEWKEEVQQELGEEMKVNHGLYIFC